MKKSSLTVLAVLPLFLTACSDPTWNKAGVNLYDTQNQLAKCQYEIGLAKVSKDEKTALLNRCMKSKGFRYN